MEYSAGLVVYKKSPDGSLQFLLLYPGQPHSYCPPKGHLEDGEDEWTAALRETEEETGLIRWKNLIIHENISGSITYEVLSKVTNENVPKKATYWPAELIAGDFVLSSEHEDGGWFSLEETIAKTTRYPGFEALLRRFVDHIMKNETPHHAG